VAGISYRDVHGIADELGVDVQTVRRWIQSGKLRAFKPGKEYRVREADLEEFLAAREVRPKVVAPPEVAGHTPEERAAIAGAMASGLEDVSSAFRRALEDSTSPDELFTIYMQASLALVGGRAIAEDAGYTADQRVVGALGQLDETADELEQAMTAAEQELPEGVALLADYQRRKAS
jgi:excisionase family DNA binding protein